MTSPSEKIDLLPHRRSRGVETGGGTALALTRREGLIALALAGAVCVVVGCDDGVPRASAVALGPVPPKNVSMLELSILTQAVRIVISEVILAPELYAYRADAAMSALSAERLSRERSLIELFDFYAALNAPGRLPFTELTDDDKRSWLDQLRTSADSTWRAAYHVVRVLAVTSFYSQSDSWAAIGYGGPSTSSPILDDSMAGVPA